MAAGTSPGTAPNKSTDMTGICSKIAQGAIAGLSAAILAGTATLAQAPRSVTILPDVPEAPADTRVPDISPMRLELLNSTVKVENAAGVAVDLLPKLEVSVGSKIGFRIATKKTGYLILLDVDANGSTAARFNIRGIPTLLVIKDGQVKEQIVGAVDKSVITKALDKHL